MSQLLIAGGLPTLLESAPQPGVGHVEARDGDLGDVRRGGARPALAPLIAMVNDPEPGISRNAVCALGEIGLAEPEALAALNAARQHPHESVRTAAEQALVTIQQGPRIWPY